VFPTKDGHIVLSIGNDPTFKRFCEAFALTHLLEDDRFATNAARVRNRQLVTDTLTPVMQQHRTVWWVDKLEALKIGCGPINKLSEVFADPHVIAREMVQEMPHGSGHTVKVIANPVRLSETPPDYRLPPPLLGEHTDAVLSERLGLDTAALAALRAKGII
jgi:crotonobetainyl-CoA:carnitine CoA-transferase CaiB-like acyl-CoA transferase